MKYRADIDGLRTIAVVPVVLFHAGIETFSGGYVGVDVFFVISGFLITSILHRETAEGSFSILRFYQRRARRILPNLLLMLLVSTAIACLLLIPADLKQFGQSVIATVAFSANIYFWMKAGYFAPNSDQLPLLHTWSLGVEEQYYLLFPLILLLFARRGNAGLKPVIWALFGASLVFSVVQVRLYPDAAFYLPMARLWELMIGSLLAIGAIAPLRRPAHREITATLGLASILLAVFGFTEATPFPGEAALLPCLGAAAIIHANATGATLVGRVLASRAFVVIGLMSYSLYLWHWPLVVFTRYALQRSLTPLEIAALLVVTVAIAFAAWKWVEQPIRSRQRWPEQRLFRVLAVSAGSVAALAMGLWLMRGLPERYSQPAANYASAAIDTNPRRLACDSPSLERLRAGDVCRIGAANVEPSFALIGDSFGDALSPGIDVAAREAGKAGLVLTRGGCLPLLGTGTPGSPCRLAVDATYGLVLRTPSIRSVILVGRWPGFLEGRRFGLAKDEHILASDDKSGTLGAAGNPAVVERGFRHSLASLNDRAISIVAYLPEQRVNVPQAATLRSIIGGDIDGVERAAFEQRQASTRALLARLAQASRFRVIDVGARLCGAGRCPIVVGDMSLYSDDNHLSRSAAIRYRSMFAESL